MPHLSIEYSANLDAAVDMAELCRVAARAIGNTGLFEVGAIRVRAFRSNAYAIADQLPENAFVDLCFRIGEGRDMNERKRAGDMIFASMREFFAPQIATDYFALSLEIQEITGSLSWKTNTLHARLRSK